MEDKCFQIESKLMEIRVKQLTIEYSLLHIKDEMNIIDKNRKEINQLLSDIRFIILPEAKKSF